MADRTTRGPLLVAGIVLAMSVGALLSALGTGSWVVQGPHPTRAIYLKTFLATRTNPAFIAARAEWRFAPSVVSSADQGIPLLNAIGDLRVGREELAVLGSTAGFSAAMTELHDLVKLPDAMQTPQQRREWSRLAGKLDAFFRTPELVG